MGDVGREFRGATREDVAEHRAQQRSVVEEARGHASLLTCALCNSLLTRLADRVEELEKERDEAYAAYRLEHSGRGVDLTQLKQTQDRVEELEAALKETIEVVEALIVSPHVQVRSIRPRMERARQALSTQPHQAR